MKEMVGRQLAGESVIDALTRAKALIEDQEYAAATQLYRGLLDTELTRTQRGEVLTNVGAALCLSARGKPTETALIQLDEARQQLSSALLYRPRLTAPAAWATTRANLALVYFARYAVTTNNDDLLAAHLALDGVDQVLHPTGNFALQNWVAAIRDQLLELRERRNRRR